MEWKAKHNPKQLDWHRSARLRLSITLLLSVILLNTESLHVPSASSPSCCCKHRVGFTFNIRPHQRTHRPVKAAQWVTCIFISIQSAFSVWKCSRSSTKKIKRRSSEKLKPAAEYYCFILVLGQVDKWTSVLQLSGQWGQTGGNHTWAASNQADGQSY